MFVRAFSERCQQDKASRSKLLVNGAPSSALVLASDGIVPLIDSVSTLED